MIKLEASLPYVSKGRLVYERLRDLILRGEIPAGGRVPLEAHAKPLGVSNMPVRDALRQLEHDGLVEDLRPHVRRMSELRQSGEGREKSRGHAVAG